MELVGSSNVNLSITEKRTQLIGQLSEIEVCRDVTALVLDQEINIAVGAFFTTNKRTE